MRPSETRDRHGIDTRWIDGECYMYADGKMVRIVGNVVMNDENNQYGGAMTQPLPTGNYRIRKDLKTYESLVEHYKTRENVSSCAMVDMYLPDEKVNNFKPQDKHITVLQLSIYIITYSLLFFVFLA